MSENRLYEYDPQDPNELAIRAYLQESVLAHSAGNYARASEARNQAIDYMSPYHPERPGAIAIRAFSEARQLGNAKGMSPEACLSEYVLHYENAQYGVKNAHSLLDTPKDFYHANTVDRARRILIDQLPASQLCAGILMTGLVLRKQFQSGRASKLLTAEEMSSVAANRRREQPYFVPAAEANFADAHGLIGSAFHDAWFVQRFQSPGYSHTTRINAGPRFAGLTGIQGRPGRGMLAAVAAAGRGLLAETPRLARNSTPGQSIHNQLNAKVKVIGRSGLAFIACAASLPGVNRPDVALKAMVRMEDFGWLVRIPFSEDEQATAAQA